MFERKAAVPVVLCSIALTACGSDGSGSAKVNQVDLGEPPVLADGTPVVAADFLSRTFPFYFVEGFSEGGATTLRRGTGAASVSADGNTITLQIGASEFVNLQRVGGANFEANGFDFLVEDLFVARTVSSNDALLAGTSNLAGGFGFQTPVSQMPTTDFAIYDVESFSRIILTQNGDADIAALDSFGTVDLVADFRDGDIAGTLFNGSGFVDIDGDNAVDDELVFILDLENGSISGNTFNGTLSGDSVAFIDGSDLFDLQPTFSGTRVDGVFFGNGASSISGTFEGDYNSRGPDGSFVGYFDVGLD